MSHDPARTWEEAAATLLAEITSDPHGEFSLSVYETARVVRYAPSLPGQERRVRFLLDEQQSTGAWGNNEYGLVPTLSATGALLGVVQNLPAGNSDGLVGAIDRGLHALFGWLEASEKSPLPDTVAVEIVVPSLIAEINSSLDPDPPPGLDAWRGRRLAQHAGGHDEVLGGLRDALVQGHTLPSKLVHTLEVFGPAARDAEFVEPAAGGVGCSPAATAVWLGDDVVRVGRHPSVRYLDAVQARGGGPVPVAAPLAVFERAWVLSTLADAGLVPEARQELIRSLHAAFGEFGVAGGAGLPPDADDTATTLTALARLGSPRSPDCLWPYQERDGHFACFAHERTPSSSTNAHVLQAFGACPTPDPSYARAMARVSAWLCDLQEFDGSWSDKWHASPYYATACCVLALSAHGGDRAASALRKAVGWVLDTQRPDGSWGRWAGTYEETAYAVQILCRARTGDAAVDRALARGYTRLRADSGEPYPPLWHDKDLYTPVRIVRAEGLAALRVAEANPRVAQLVAAGGRRGEET